MRVLIDTDFAARGVSGTGVYLEQLVPALEALGVEVVTVPGRSRRPGRGGPRSALNLARDVARVQAVLPRLARAARADVLHHPLPALVRAAPCAQVVTVHDLAFERLPACFDPRWRLVARRSHRAAARGAGAVIVPSEATGRDVRARWAVPERRIVVAPHGPGQLLPAVPPREPPEHFLYVGDAEPRKNVGRLLVAYAAYRAEAGAAALPLVLAGRVAPDAVAALPRTGLVFEPDPAPARLAALHAAAACLVAPSLHEGFGLPALEALRAGTPVLAARTAGLAEVCAEAARWVDPRDPASIAAGLAELAASPRARADLRARGRRRAAEFTWERSARAHLAAYTLASPR